MGRYTQEEIAELVDANRERQTAWRWVTLGTYATRDYAGPQLVAIQVVYLAAVLMIYGAERVSPSVDSTLLHWWLAEALANLLVRVALFAKMMRLNATTFVRGPWRLVPPFNAFVVGCHWAWTAVIFVGPSLTPTVLVTIVAFILMSFGTMTIAPASPMAAVVYLAFLWIPILSRISASGWITPGIFMLLLVAVGVLLALGFWLSVGPVLRYLQKSDEVDLLVGELQTKNGELERLRDAAATELQTRSAFFAGASHDFRQRLHAMKLLAHSASETAGWNSPSLGKLGGALEDLETYISDVLEFARLESGGLVPQLTMIEIQDLFQDLELQFEDVAAKHGVDLSFRATSATVLTDRTMLLRILENLTSNAIKFTRREVLVAARRHAGSWSIEVWDRGPGIEPTVREKIFDAFYQGDGRAAPRAGGVGLGLAIVRKLAECMGYSVRVISKQGHGTAMKVLIPAPGPR